MFRNHGHLKKGISTMKSYEGICSGNFKRPCGSLLYIKFVLQMYVYALLVCGGVESLPWTERDRIWVGSPALSCNITQY